MPLLSRPVGAAALVAWLACSSLACTTMPTAVVVVMDSNIPADRPMQVTVRVASSDESNMWATYQWSRGITGRPSTLEMPSSFTVMPKTGAPRSGAAVLWFDVDVPQGSAGAERLRFSRRLHVTFTPGQTTRARAFLAAECGSVAADCPASNPRCTLADLCDARGMTCGEGGRCEALEVTTVPFSDPDAHLSFIDATTSNEAGMDSARDVVSPPNDASTPDAVVVPDGCSPMCTGRVCGDDQCGGSCGSCAPRPNMVPSCSAAGQCQYTCQMGFGDCDADQSNGCETTLNTDANCGMCGRRCEGATPVCGGAACGTGCPPGRTRCGTACVDTQTDVANCGACGTSCAVANGTPACVAGACRVATCNADFADCDGNAANGCETSLNTAMNCGACRRTCSGATPNCDTGAGMCTSGCTGAQVRCGAACVETATDVSNCGSCGNACPSRPNAMVSCAASACRYTCNAGFGDCDGNMANGCETALNSTTHCGMCGRACSFANGSASCTAGSCALAGCTTGFGNCDGNMTNGCETPLNSTTHCGMCSRACSVANGVATCASGTCQVASCNGGFGNCDGNPANGCETNTTNTPAHCSNCGNGCPSRANASTTCSSSTCGFSCTSGFADCNSNGADGCEANLGTISNCGACGRVCSFANATALCSAGSCALGACNAGWANCDGNPANGCETSITTTSNCGGCGVGCSRANATATCASGSCAIGSCNAGWGNCDGNDANGCETNTNSNNSHCGTCNNACSSPHTCIGGGCDCAGPIGCDFPRHCCEFNPVTCGCMYCACQSCACP
ncbi:MAG: hypothetical protein JNK05_40190 [Myxococcales bacterium]|nr:hypothetical protein [Myxococcales bacterium]